MIKASPSPPCTERSLDLSTDIWLFLVERPDQEGAGQKTNPLRKQRSELVSTDGCPDAPLVGSSWRQCDARPRTVQRTSREAQGDLRKARDRSSPSLPVANTDCVPRQVENTPKTTHVIPISLPSSSLVPNINLITSSFRFLPPKDLLLHRPRPQIHDRSNRHSELETNISTVRLVRSSDLARDRSSPPLPNELVVGELGGERQTYDLVHSQDGHGDAAAESKEGCDAGREEGCDVPH